MKETAADFFRYVAQTSPMPMGVEIVKAKGNYLYSSSNKKILDFVAGVSANTLGHNHPVINQSIIDQLQKFTHVMVYGEFILKPQIDLAKKIAETLPSSLSCTYFTNSGTEATEGALKLAKRVTGRFEIVAAENAYHGNTQGALSISGKESQKSAFRPLITGSKEIRYNNFDDLKKITNKTAAVILETIQGGAGFILPEKGYLKAVKEKCKDLGVLLILDEIQTGIGRTGTFWGFENFELTPDILIAGKGLGGGMPIGAFISSKEYMDTLKTNPVLGHITTFGGHPIVMAAALATIQEIEDSKILEEISEKEKLFKKLLQHTLIKEIRGKGLMLALMLPNPKLTHLLIKKSLDKGLLLFGLLFHKNAVRITPPLTITKEEIKIGCELIIEILDEIKILENK